MDKETAFSLWESLFPGQEEAYDYASHKIRKEDFRNGESEYGWDVDMIKPRSAGGTYRNDNLLPACLSTILLRDGKSAFRIGNLLYEVRKGRRYGTFAIYDTTQRDHPIDLTPDEKTQDPLFNEERMARSLGRKKEERIPAKALDLNAPLRNGLLRADITKEGEEPLAEEKEQEKENDVLTTEEKTSFVEPSFEEKSEEEKVEEEEAVKTEETASVVENEEVAEEQEEVSAPIEPEEEKAEEKPIEEETVEEKTVEENVPVIETEEKETIEETVHGKVLEEREEPVFTVPEEKKEDDVAKRLAEQEKILEETRKRGDSLKEQLEEKMKELSLLKEELATVKVQKEELAGDLEKERKEHDDLSSRLLALEEEKNGLTKTLQEKEESLLKLSESLQGRKEEDGQVLLLKQDIEKARAEIRQKDETIASLSKDKSDFETSLAAKEEEKTRLQEKMAELEKEILAGKNDWTAEKEKLVADKETAENELAQLRKAKEEDLLQNENERKEKDSLLQVKENAIQALEDEKGKLLEEKASANKEIERLQTRLQEESQEKEETIHAKMELEGKLNASLEKEKGLTEEKEKADKEIERLQGEIAAINEKGMQNESLMIEKDKNIALLTDEKEENAKKAEDKTREDEEKIESLEEEKKRQEEENEKLREKILLCSCHGKEEAYPTIKEKILAEGLEYNKENIEKILYENPDLVQPIDNRIYKAPKPTNAKEEKVELDRRIDFSYKNDERERKAYNYYEKLIGEGKIDATDFASREIKERHYRREDTPFGWDYALFDPNAPEEEGNVFVANLKTIAEYRPGTRFHANGHEFSVVEKNGKKHFVSLDSIADPYDFENALQVSENNLQKKTPLIYIYVKACGVTSTFPERKAVNAFFDLVDRTVKRCAPASFIEMQANSGSNSDYLFLTFDGNRNNAYKEAFDYAILLNSYRTQFKKKGGLNAIIVLDEIEVPFSMRHLSFDRLYSETKDVDLNAIRYDLTLTTVISNTVKRTVHIGPQILDKVPISRDRLNPSRLGSGTFSDLFGFGKSYMECNFVFDLTRKADEENND